MRKKLKSILSVILALAMVACMAVPALAEGNIIIYNGTSGPQQVQPGPGPGPGPQGPQGGPQQGPGPAPQERSPKSNSNYNYAVLKGNKGTYTYDVSSTFNNHYVNVSSSFEKPENGKVKLSVFSMQPSTDGLYVQLNVLNGLSNSITIKRLDWLLIMKDGEVIAKVPHQLVDKNNKVTPGSNGAVSFTVDPQYFNHNAKLTGGSFSVEADLVYD